MEVTKEFLQAAKAAERIRFKVDRLRKGLFGTIRFSRNGSPVWSSQQAEFGCLGHIQGVEYDNLATTADCYLEDKKVWSTFLSHLRVGDTLRLAFETYHWGSKDSGIWIDSLYLEVVRPGKKDREFRYMMGSYPYKDKGHGWCQNYMSRDEYREQVNRLNMAE